MLCSQRKYFCFQIIPFQDTFLSTFKIVAPTDTNVVSLVLPDRQIFVFLTSLLCKTFHK